MKRPILLFLFGFTLLASACAPLSGDASCRKGMCVKLRAVEPILFGVPLKVTISVTTDNDVPSLGVSLSSDFDVVVEGPQGWEESVRDGIVWNGGAGWRLSTRANQTVQFVRTVRLPPREGFFLLIARAGIPTGESVEDSLYIHLTLAGGTVYLSGTPLPITPDVIKTPPPYILNPQGTPLPIPTSAPFTFPPTPTRAPYP